MGGVMHVAVVVINISLNFVLLAAGRQAFSLFVTASTWSRTYKWTIVVNTFTHMYNIHMLTIINDRNIEADRSSWAGHARKR